MSSIKDFYDISVNGLRLINNLLKKGLKEREIESVLRETLQKAQVPDNLSEIIDDAKKSLSPKNPTVKALEKINKNVNSKVTSKKPAAKKVAKKLATRKLIK